jgi:LmbE family N-acetylglucosaminyl deacetylase
VTVPPGADGDAAVAAPAPDAPPLPVGELPWHGPATTAMPVPRVAVAIGAHPDDVDFGCGGTLAKWAAAGCTTHHVVLTDGSKGTWDPGDDLAALVATRQAEQRAAADILGSASVTFLGQVDGELQSGLAERRALCRVLRELRPDVVLGHDPWRRYRLHPDHRHAGWLTLDAVVAARDPAFFPDLGVPPHRPHTVLLFEADEPDHVEDIGTTLPTKVDALLAHRSQHRSTMGIGAADNAAEVATFRRAVAAQASRHGRLAGLAFAEAFHRIGEV